ncbi:MAG: GNAT family N-acetyltransferase [Cyanobacteria bacterium P01_H01_bin.15]
MSASPNNAGSLQIRPVHSRDWGAIEAFIARMAEREDSDIDLSCQQASRSLGNLRPWFRLLEPLRLFPNPLKSELNLYLAEQDQQIQGLVKVAPFNHARTTWEIEWLLADPSVPALLLATGMKGSGSQLLRYCLEQVLEARTWLLEVEINQKRELSLYRENGFQPLAHVTYWHLDPELLDSLATQSSELANLMPVGNADAQVLYQLDTVSMPPLLRQVFDRHEQDFRSDLGDAVLAQVQRFRRPERQVCGYVFEPQRRAAIGYYALDLVTDGSRSHEAKLTVHPAYTWLYPKLLGQMAQLVQAYPSQSLRLASTDYQSEREEFLAQLGAAPAEQTLLMSRSVWHKLREVRPLDGLQLPEVLQGLKPARTPIPSRIAFDTFGSLPERNPGFETLSESDRPLNPGE